MTVSFRYGRSKVPSRSNAAATSSRHVAEVSAQPAHTRVQMATANVFTARCQCGAATWAAPRPSDSSLRSSGEHEAKNPQAGQSRSEHDSVQLAERCILGIRGLSRQNDLGVDVANADNEDKPGR